LVVRLADGILAPAAAESRSRAAVEGSRDAGDLVSVPVPETRRVRAWATAALLAGVLVYAPTLGHGFTFDDRAVILKNRNLGSPGGLPNLILETEFAGAGIRARAWRPLTALTYAANHRASGLAPWSYHATNVLLHGLTSLLVLLLGMQLGLSPTAAGAGALLFAVHPIHVEAVANVVGRKDVLATGFVVLMLLAHRWSIRRGGLRPLAPIAAYLAAMLSKESGTVGIALAVVCDLVMEGGFLRPGGLLRRRALAHHLAYAVALGAFLLAYRAITGGVTLDGLPHLIDNPAAHAPFAVRLMTAIAVAGKGLALQLLPLGQSPDWSYDAIPLVRSPADVRFVAAAAGFVAWGVVGVAARRARPTVLLGLCWYLAALAPVANVLFSTGTIFGERLLYMPSAGLALLVGGLFAAEIGPRATPRTALVARGAWVTALAMLAAASVRYGAAWSDDLTLFTWARDRVPRSTKVHDKLAQELLLAGRGPEALAEVRVALEILPTNGFAEVTHATILARLGRDAEREQSARRALELLPGDVDAMYQVACVSRDAGRIDEAAEIWNRIVAKDALYGPALADLSGWHFLRGEDELAIAAAKRAVESAGGASAWYNLALVYGRRGDTARAREALQRFVENAGPEYVREAAAVRAQLGAVQPAR
jgi:tetratricopeptide (TPR) repeat protein